MKFSFKKYQRSFSIGVFLLLGMLAIAGSVNVSCGNNNATSYKKLPPDSVRSWCLFTTPAQWGLGEGLRIEFIDRKTRDTTYFDTLDENTAKKTYKRDTSYWIYVSTYDMDSVTKKPKLDSLKGLPIIKQTYFLQLPKENIKHDFNNYTP